jgi:hypothetical protein
VDCTFFPRSKPVIGIPSDDSRGSEQDGDEDEDGKIVPLTPRPRDFVREELSESACVSKLDSGDNLFYVNVINSLFLLATFHSFV